MSDLHRARMLRIKRILDIVVATTALVLLAPLFVLVAAAILLTDGRPIFYRQQRVGRFGVLFTIVKFRTMVNDAHDRRHEIAEHNERVGPLFKMTQDPRVTRVGRLLRRTSLDELPQLFNVWSGSMSLVGPRPCLPEERAQFPAELLAREQLPQGITGLWQLDARHESNFERYQDLDLAYVRDWTIGHDIKILGRTPFVVLRHAARREGKAAAASSKHLQTTGVHDALESRASSESVRPVPRPVWVEQPRQLVAVDE